MLTEGLSSASTLVDLVWRSLFGGLIMGTLTAVFAWLFFDIQRWRTFVVTWVIAVAICSWGSYCELQWYAATHPAPSVSSSTETSPPTHRGRFTFTKVKVS